MKRFDITSLLALIIINLSLETGHLGVNNTFISFTFTVFAQYCTIYFDNHMWVKHQMLIQNIWTLFSIEWFHYITVSLLIAIVKLIVPFLRSSIWPELIFILVGIWFYVVDINLNTIKGVLISDRGLCMNI